MGAGSWKPVTIILPPNPGFGVLNIDVEYVYARDAASADPNQLDWIFQPQRPQRIRIGRRIPEAMWRCRALRGGAGEAMEAPLA